uniref:ADSL_C domain-containing protein n=1 Tax=Globodera pallida TaxID=36090 RepID=A0A183C5G8_GLOPA
MHSTEQYGSIFAERWCRGSPLLHIFSPQNKALIWRQLWIWLAESERELGLGALISQEMVDELKAQKGNIDWDKIKEIERQLKHDVMAHIQAYGEAFVLILFLFFEFWIIHLGATSCFVQDNADLIVQRDALDHLLKRLAICLHRLANFAEKYADVPIEGRTHFQPASLTTVGKRAVLWADGLLHAFKKLNQVRDELRFRGVKGAVGTQDALLQLFDGDAARTKALDAAVAQKAGFGSRVFGVCGQTYPRYQDSDVLFALSSLASAAAKFASDLRVLQAFGEMSEPFDAAHQVGSSAMPYKRNPMLCERICGIARYMMVNSLNPLFTFAEQGLERTLDDSANRRIRVFEGMRVYESVVRTSVHKSGALLERALMLLTQRGGNRQEAHESIRQIAMNGVTGDDLLGALPAEIRDDLRKLIDQPLLMCGRAEQQTRDFLANELRPTIAEELGKVSDDDKQKTIVLDV